ncbi:glycerophosphodiester phosphodiesterase family protein [Tsukamurella sp. 8F]|uniref:glycerophosphodiester phosphodiesterase n=1 Tax=unclassified Tsukamurella TaxID=2633480 RepID=UPI0023B9667B|nr:MULTISPECIES: glycerophosphodiester phosphodiesterase family protein [unclassified Tsukamurella]MDF0530822.1 glycerophosphodiester phosphodiesterase family protein [Tsukamurella sp. 8J]MDF0589524.1 glycerophosphodiester phosphodiesterase family protein [Tsukamurella sp. 8F]
MGDGDVADADRAARAPLIVAHRGASGEYPEHTMAAFHAAIVGGADALECDVRLTKDHHLVCLHDRTVERVSDGIGAVSELTLEDLRAMDFGSRHSGVPASVVTLDELIELATADRGVGLFVETKHPVRYGPLVEQKLLAALHRHGLARPDDPLRAPVTIISFSAAAVWRVRRNAPQVPTVLLGDASHLLGGGTATAVRAHGIGPSVASLRERPDTVARARAAGRFTYCWTVDGEADFALCCGLGVDQVATNHPARARAWLAAG